MKRRRHFWPGLIAIAILFAGPGAADPPILQDFLSAMKLSDADVEKVRAGEIIAGSAKASNERELVATMAFLVPGVAPDDLVERGQGGLLDEIDEHTIAYATHSEDPKLEDFAGLRLRQGDIEQFSRAEAGDDLNLSSAEIESFETLGRNPSNVRVEETVRAALFERLRAYRTSGLAGIAAYQRSGGDSRSAADDLKAATRASEAIHDVAPSAYQALLEYPRSMPEGTEEAYRWSYLEAHDEPTIVLSHYLYIPDGEAWIVMQRQFYVSEGYNCEQAIAAFVPVTEGTAVFYINRTSTDQVSGFGGGAKRSIGSKMLASQLTALFKKVSSVAESE